ncbi:unnamed protein product [Rhizophagus irregularis]|nr:unnamed protein product [Rhizophagus irregularis]
MDILWICYRKDLPITQSRVTVPQLVKSTKHVDGYSIETHPDVAKTVLSIHIDNPPIRFDDPTNITPSLDYIK